MAEEIAKIEFSCKRTKSPPQISQAISGAGLRQIPSSANSISFEHVETRDIFGRPCLFWRIHFRPDRLVFEYSSPRDCNQKKRRLQMLSALLEVLALCDCYLLSNSQLYEIISASLRGSIHFIDAKYESLLNKYEKAESQRKKLAGERHSLSSLLEKENSIRLELEKKNAQLQRRLAFLDGISDSELENELFEWLRFHNGRICIPAFASAHSISEKRVEEGLSKLARGGCIERKE